MSKRTPVVEWYVAESDADWERLHTPPLPDVAPNATHRPRLNRSFWCVAALLLLLASTGGWRWRTAQSTTHPAATDLTATAQHERGTIEHVGEPAAARPPDHQSGIDWWSQHKREDSDLRAA
jgi:hypothetical protein